MEMDYVAAFEAVLFSSGEPVSVDKLSAVFDLEFDRVNQLMDQLAERLSHEGRGIELVKLQNAYQLCTKTVYGDVIRRMAELRRKTPLSGAALEVLAVIAYNQPVTKAFIEQVRGVDCSGVVGTLVEKGLIEERGRLELPGKPLLYGTTKNFLRCFSLSDLTELPPLPKDENAKESTAEQIPITEEHES